MMMAAREMLCRSLVVSVCEGGWDVEVVILLGWLQLKSLVLL
jgi:hypothetical protein